MKIRILGYAFIALALVCAPAAHAKDPTPFPGRTDVLASPDKKLKVENHDPDENGQFHMLALVGDGLHRILLEYERSVEVAWSPDSRHLFVNNHAESDETTCIVYSMDGGTDTDLADSIARFSPQAARIMGYGHRYLECRKWFQPGKILVKLHGYDSADAQGTLWLAYDLAGGFEAAPPALIKRALKHEQQKQKNGKTG